MAGKVDFFISFAEQDAEWASWISYVLEEAGYRTLNQRQDMRPGHNFVHQIQQGTLADRTIMVLSPDYFDRPFPESEWGAAYSQDPVGVRRKLVPVRVRPCAPPGLLAQIVYIDLVGLTRDEAHARLLDGLMRARPRPTEEPRFPGGPG
ncbi:toll/interleukin-1 receptor domain-containing protein [Allokutzneria oryzae]|uniref:Toll/interleukin-1 receptor domain-containing protein n=1 Tax=Allokutzneria oryzae TaxID=1378989 RepID=A0ABV5ZZL3_9PSEU